MFKRLDVPLISNPICNKAVDDIGEDAGGTNSGKAYIFRIS
jgi:hypothetical protein